MTHTPSANQWLRRFRVDITSNSNRVYANGRQQVEVTVTLEPRDGQTITEQSLASLELLQIDDQGQFHILDAELQAHHERDPRFAYHAASGVAPSPLMESSPRTIRRRFYVSSTLPGGTVSTLYAGIWKDEQTHFETNVAPFKSSAVIESISPQRLPESAFELKMEDTIAYKVATERYWDDEVEHQVGYFGLRDPNNFIVASSSQATPDGHAFYERHNWDHALISFQLTNDYSQHAKVSVHGVDQAFELDVPGSRGRLTQRPHQMTLHRYHQRFYTSHYNSLSEEQSLWQIIDRNGNEHHIEFLSKDNGRAIDFQVIQGNA